MRETKERYYEAMRDLAIRRIIAVECVDTCNDEEEEEVMKDPIAPYRRSGRIEFAARFSRKRCAFAKQYYLSHRLIRRIVAKAYLLLPEMFCDFARYRGLEFLDVDK